MCCGMVCVCVGRMSPHKERVEAMTLLGVAGVYRCMQAGLFSPPAYITHARTPFSFSFRFYCSLAPLPLSLPSLSLSRSRARSLL